MYYLYSENKIAYQLRSYHAYVFEDAKVFSHDVGHIYMYMWYIAICNVCKNISNEFIETISNMSFKIECRSVLVTNAESCAYTVHSCVKLLFKKKSGAQIYV